MASRSLGVLTLDLVAKVGGFVKGMDQAERKARSSLGSIEKRASAFGKSIGAALGLSLAGIATGAVAALKGAIDRMDELRDASIRLGVGVETLSAFSYAAQQTGTDVDALGKGMKILAKNAADALNPKSPKFALFEAIGVSVKDQAGNLRDLDAILLDVADRYKGLQDGTTKAALAQELFGKSGLDLTEFLNQGSDGLKEMTDRARELGLVIDQEAADKADKFNDSLNDLKGAVTGLASDVAIELLPKLTEMVEWAQDWVKDGDNAASIAGDIASGIRDIAAALKGLGSFLGVLDDLRIGLNNVQQSMVNGNWFTIARKQFQQQLGLNDDWSRGPQGQKAQAPFNPNMFRIPGLDRGGSGFSAVPTGVDYSKYGSSSAINQKALNRALGGIKDSPAKKGHSGKSDAEKEAERLAKAINQMTDAQREWQTELDGTGNKIADEYARRLDEITEKSEDFIQNGIPKERVAQFREEMTKLAEGLKSKETVEFLKEFGYETQEMIASANGASTANIQYARAIDELDKALKSGIISQDEYAKRAEALSDVRDASALQVLRDIQTEKELLGTSIEYQDTYNKLKYAGVEANSAFGQSIIESNHALHEQAKAVADQTELMDEFRGGLADAFGDIIDGSKSAKEAFSDFFDDLAAKLLRMIVENWIERAFGEMGTTGGKNSGGSGWGAALGQFASALFGGGRAIGGPVAAGGMYRVNENQPELLSMGGRDYLMMGAQSGQVSAPRMTPQRAASGPMTVNINIPGRETTATRDQAAGYAEYYQRRQRARNGKRS